MCAKTLTGLHLVPVYCGTPMRSPKSNKDGDFSAFFCPITWYTRKNGYYHKDYKHGISQMRQHLLFFGCMYISLIAYTTIISPPCVFLHHRYLCCLSAFTVSFSNARSILLFSMTQSQMYQVQRRTVISQLTEISEPHKHMHSPYIHSHTTHFLWPSLNPEEDNKTSASSSALIFGDV